eukprot:ANDGO_07251.mRNA.1 putative copper-transporting ATPase HMA5
MIDEHLIIVGDASWAGRDKQNILQADSRISGVLEVTIDPTQRHVNASVPNLSSDPDAKDAKWLALKLYLLQEVDWNLLIVVAWVSALGIKIDVSGLNFTVNVATDVVSVKRPFTHDEQPAVSTACSNGLTFAVKRMRRASCAAAISRDVKVLPGVTQVDVAVLLDEVTVSHDFLLSNNDTIAGAITECRFEAFFVSDSVIQKTQTKNAPPIVYGYEVSGVSCHRRVDSVKVACFMANPLHVVKVDALSSSGCGQYVPAHKSAVEKKCHVVASSETKELGSPVPGPRILLNATHSPNFSAYQVTERIRESVLRTREIRSWRKRFLSSLIFTIPVVIIAMGLVWVPSIHMNRYLWMSLGFVQFVLSSYVQFVSGTVFHKQALIALRGGSTTMDVLISIGTFAAYIYSVFSLAYMAADASFQGDFFFEAAASLIAFMLLGKYLENVAKSKSSEAMTKLLDLKPSNAIPVTGIDRSIDNERIVASLIEEGDIPLVKIAGKIPCDEAVLTRESMPVQNRTNLSAMGGTVVHEGMLFIRASRLGDDATLSQILRLMENVPSSKVPSQRLASRISGIFVPVIIAHAIVGYFIWLGVTLSDAVLASPLHPSVFSSVVSTAVLIGCSVGATLGILINSGKDLGLAS